MTPIATKERALTMITALGTQKSIIRELIDFFNGGEKLKYNTDAEKIRKQFSGQKVTKVILIITSLVQNVFNEVKNDLNEIYPEVELEPVELPFDDLRSSEDDEKVKKVLYEKIAALAGRSLIIASAGRKTITQRLIEAGLLHGCAGYISLTASTDKEGPACSDEHKEGCNVLWISGRQFARERYDKMFCDRKRFGGMFRSVYLLPNSLIQELQDDEKAIGRAGAAEEAELAWLSSLPKADLHCHLGGCQHPELLTQLAQQLEEDLEIVSDRKQRLRSKLENVFDCRLEDLQPENLVRLQSKRGSHCLHGLQALLREKVGLVSSRERCEAMAVLVQSLSPERLRNLSRSGRIGDDGQTRWPQSEEIEGANLLDWYMACGNLGGSALLQSRKTLRLAVHSLIDECVRENVCYLEIRCSPDNYTRAGLLTIDEAMRALLDAAQEHNDVERGKIRVHFLVMATRHKSRYLLQRHVALALLFSRNSNGRVRVCGFDLAGQEEDYEPSQFQEEFLPLHRACMNITIHAGEMAEEEAIWQAIYLLHAKRIGHGLQLHWNRRMMDFVRDHGLAIEMCPSSNLQTKGFRKHPQKNASTQPDVYPLKEYLEHGILVTVNTDNRFISETSLSREYLQAARLSPQGLNRWQVLQLIRNGFRCSFLPKDEKDELLKDVDEKIFNLFLESYWPENMPNKEGA